MKQIQSVLVCLGILLSFVACEKEEYTKLSSEVPQESIFARYDVVYNQVTDTTQVLARLEFGYRLVVLDGDASIHFNGDILSYDERSFHNYFKTYEGQVSGTFEYTDLDNRTFQNTIPDYRSVSFPNEVDTFSRSQKYTFVWEGEPLEANEVLRISYPTEMGGATTNIPKSQIEDNTISFYPGRLSKMPLGEAEFSIIRERTILDIESTAAGATVRAIYEAAPKKVFIVE